MATRIKPDNDNVDIDPETQVSEESPLLQNTSPQRDGPSKAFRRRTLGMCMLALLMVEVSQFIMNPPTKKIIEDIICRQHYPDHAIQSYWIEDLRCKDSPVQKTLAMVQGWAQAFEMGVRKLACFRY
jgi:hypothetical protein